MIALKYIINYFRLLKYRRVSKKYVRIRHRVDAMAQLLWSNGKRCTQYEAEEYIELEAEMKEIHHVVNVLQSQLVRSKLFYNDVLSVAKEIDAAKSKYINPIS